MATKVKQPRNQIRSESVVWLSSEEAAERLGKHPGTLMNWRSLQKPDQPPYYKSGQTVRYKLSDLEAWIESHRVEF